MPETNNKSAKDSIYKAMLEDDLSKAELIEKNNNFSALEITGVAERAFSQLMKTQDYIVAIKVAERYSLPIEKKLEAISAQFRSLAKNKDFERAIDWGLKYRLPGNDINNVSVRAFISALEKKEVEKALEYKRKYNIPHNLIAHTALQTFNQFFERRKYIEALYLGQDFEISRKRILTAGVRGYHQVLKDNDISKFFTIEKLFKVLIDRDIEQIDESDFNNFAETFNNLVVKKLILENRTSYLADIINKLDFFNNRENNRLIDILFKQSAEQIAEAHSQLIDQDRYDEAFKLVESFHLLSSDISPETKIALISSAESAHHKLIEKNNINGAKIVKDNYSLFEKNIIANSLEKVTQITLEYLEKALQNAEIDNVKKVIEEYQLSKDEIKVVITKSLIKLLKSRKFLESFTIIKNLNPAVTFQEIQEQAKESFSESYEAGQLELAANLAFYYKLNDPKAVKAGFIIWKRYIEDEKFKEALEIKKRLKLPRKLVEPVLKDVYAELIEDKKSNMAQKLRMDYRLKLSVWEWFMGVFKKFIG
ncbi:hypothetical protein ACFL5P_01325 [candidate division KSB1 bacterium]